MRARRALTTAHALMTSTVLAACALTVSKELIVIEVSFAALHLSRFLVAQETKIGEAGEHIGQVFGWISKRHSYRVCPDKSSRYRRLSGNTMSERRNVCWRVVCLQQWLHRRQLPDW